MRLRLGRRHQSRADMAASPADLHGRKAVVFSAGLVESQVAHPVAVYGYVLLRRSDDSDEGVHPSRYAIVWAEVPISNGEWTPRWTPKRGWEDQILRLAVVSILVSIFRAEGVDLVDTRDLRDSTGVSLSGRESAK